MKKRNKFFCSLLLICLLFSCSACGKDEEPTRIMVWNYYNDKQLLAFNDLVDDFNATVGQKEGIFVETCSIGSINDLTASIYATVNGEAGAKPLPNIVAAYPSTAITLYEKNQLVDLSPYLSEKEKNIYIDGYLQEGDLTGNGSLYVFPVAKSTEILLLNNTDWLPFAEATGVSYDDLETFEGITAVSEKYYEWTDSLTETPNDGKALFGRDAMANYFYLGAAQLGEELIQREGSEFVVKLDEQVMRKLWDNYYVPMVKGHFNAIGRFRSDGVKTGDLLVYLGSSSSASFFPKEVILDDNSSYPIEVKALPCPHFVDGDNYAIQQGAGMVVINAEKEVVEASVTFLKWFTRQENNIEFSVASGYLPVTKEANNLATICAVNEEVEQAMLETLAASIDTIVENELYTALPITEGEEIRAILEDCLNELAKADQKLVRERLATGMTKEEATAEFLTEEYFQKWYQTLVRDIEQVLQK